MLPNPYDVLFAHVVLPDSLDERRKVLQAFAAVVRKSHPAYRSINEQISALDRLGNLQKELPLKFAGK
jgi:hypothetical protein